MASGQRRAFDRGSLYSSTTLHFTGASTRLYPIIRRSQLRGHPLAGWLLGWHGVTWLEFAVTRRVRAQCWAAGPISSFRTFGQDRLVTTSGYGLSLANPLCYCRGSLDFEAYLSLASAAGALARRPDLSFALACCSEGLRAYWSL